MSNKSYNKYRELFLYLESIQFNIENIEILTYGWKLSRREVYYIEIKYKQGLPKETIQTIENRIKDYVPISFTYTYPPENTNKYNQIHREYKIKPTPRLRSKHYILFTQFPLKIENQEPNIVQRKIYPIP